jgi:hypothetical protein
LGIVNLCAGFVDLAYLFGARPSSVSERPERVEERDSGDGSLHDGTR